MLSRRFALLCLPLATLLGHCMPAAKHSAATKADLKTYTIEEFLNTTGYRGGSFSPDNTRVLVSSDASGIFNAYAIPVDGQPAVQLTHSAVESIYTIGYFPHDERFLYSSDEGGNELNHIFVREVDGTVVDLTPGEGHKAIFHAWALDDESFFIGTNERDQRYFDVYEISTGDYSRQMIYQNEEGYLFAAITPDRNFIALLKLHTRDDSDIYLYNRQAGELVHLTPHEGNVNHQPQTFGADGQKLYFLTDLDSEFTYLIEHDLASGNRSEVVRADWDIRYANLSKRGRYLVVAVNDDASTDLRVYNSSSMERLPLPELPKGEITSVSISGDETRMAMYLSGSRIPRDLFYWELGSSSAKRLTRSLSPAIDPDHLVEAEVVRFESFDGLEVPGILYKPHLATRANQAPALLWVHGGPGGQSRVGYSGLLQYLVNHGYAVFAINNRGSSGYGKTFQRLDDQKHGEGDLDDCVASKRMLSATGYVDPDRMGILGGSYGGYMTLAALAFRPTEFSAGVDLFGISNWYRTLQNIPPWWEAMRKLLEMEMGDFDDEEYQKSISPLFYSDQIVKPLMVLQGANDPRVLQAESDDIVAAVRENDVPVEYIVFEDEGHGFQKKENRIRGYRAIREFLDVHLKNSDPSGS